MKKTLSIKQMMGYAKKPNTTDATLHSFVDWLETQCDRINAYIGSVKLDKAYNLDCSSEERFLEERFELAKAIARHPKVSQNTLCELWILSVTWPASVVKEIVEYIQDAYTLSVMYDDMRLNLGEWSCEEWEEIRKMIASKNVSNASCFNRISYDDVSTY